MTEAGRTVTLRQLPDLLDFLDALNEARAKYLVIGGHAVGLHGHSRATKDLDVWIGEDAANREAAISALEAFGAPESVFRNLASASKDEFVFLGHPPQRIDLLQSNRELRPPRLNQAVAKVDKPAPKRADDGHHVVTRDRPMR